MPPLDNEEQPKDPAEFAIMISAVTSALLKDGTEIPYREHGISAPRISVRPSPQRKLAMTLSYVWTILWDHLTMYLMQMNRMLTENRLLAVILKNNMYIINQQSIDHISHLLDNDRA